MDWIRGIVSQFLDITEPFLSHLSPHIRDVAIDPGPAQ
jgi:hypothetical protein